MQCDFALSHAPASRVTSRSTAQTWKRKLGLRLAGSREPGLEYCVIPAGHPLRKGLCPGSSGRTGLRGPDSDSGSRHCWKQGDLLHTYGLRVGREEAKHIPFSPACSPGTREQGLWLCSRASHPFQPPHSPLAFFQRLFLPSPMAQHGIAAFCSSLLGFLPSMALSPL